MRRIIYSFTLSFFAILIAEIVAKIFALPSLIIYLFAVYIWSASMISHFMQMNDLNAPPFIRNSRDLIYFFTIIIFIILFAFFILSIVKFGIIKSIVLIIVAVIVQIPLSVIFYDNSLKLVFAFLGLFASGLWIILILL